jgi:hypothetical protein
MHVIKILKLFQLYGVGIFKMFKIYIPRFLVFSVAKNKYNRKSFFFQNINEIIFSDNRATHSISLSIISAIVPNFLFPFIGNH